MPEDKKEEKKVEEKQEKKDELDPYMEKKFAGTDLIKKPVPAK